MELLKKFASRKFIMALASFGMSIAAVVWGQDNQWVQLVGAAGAVLAPVVYILAEAWIDGKNINTTEFVPTIATAVNDLVQIYENRYGENEISNFMQDLTALVNHHFEQK